MTQDHVALYRKYRPQSFADVRGQEQVVNVLQGALKQKNIGHAYLFAGSRGTGKTSVARIFAREIGTHDTDLYELDAASNRGIDDVRALREAVFTSPFQSPYKVYIIDEVHMLTKEAFNALLKTLEEPPSHVIFILATTEMEKLPDTIISRCEVHTFKQPSRAMLKERVVDVAKQEGFALEHAAADLVALLADGSFRDALGILQKIIFSSSDKKISIDEVSLITSAPKGELVNAVLQSIQDNDAKKGIDALTDAANAGVAMKVFAKLLLEKMRAILLLRYTSDMKSKFAEEFSEHDFVFLEGLSGKESRITSAVLSRFLSAYSAIDRAYITHLPLELALLDCVEGK
jgi:DNA polymerase-3 subunit gamma/tau